MSQAPGQSTVPFEEFTAEARKSLGYCDLHFTAVELSDHRVRVHSGMGDKEFSTRAEAHAYMEEQRRTWGETFGNFYRIVNVSHEPAAAEKKPAPRPSHTASQARKEEAHPPTRALQQTPPKAGSEKAGPPPPAKTSASSVDRAKAASPKSPAERPVALAVDAGAEQFLSDTIGSVPALVGMVGATTLNPVAVYEAGRMSDFLKPFQQKLEDDAAERFHRAEGTAPNWLVGGVAFGTMVIPQMIGGPEEEGALAAEQVARAQATVVRVGLARLSRMAEAAETGSLRSVVTDERLFAKMQAVLAKPSKAKNAWASFRARAGNQLSELYKTALHHFKYPRSSYKSEVLNLEQLWVAGGSSHAKLHAAEGLTGFREIPGKGMLPKAYFGMDTNVEIGAKELENMLRFWTARENPAEARALAQSGTPTLSVQLQEELSWAQFEDYLNHQQFGKWNPEEWVGSFARNSAKPRAGL